MAFFAGSDERTMAKVLPLIENASFMKASLEDLQQIINENGVIEEYQNGENQHGMKQSSALQAYNQLIKNYTAVMKEIGRIMPIVHEEPEWYLRSMWLNERRSTDSNETFEDWKERRKKAKLGA